MQEFEPRLLMPGALGIPSHIVVSHDPAVYEEMGSPGKTVIYVPRWSAPVRDIFARLAAQPNDPTREYESHHYVMRNMSVEKTGELRDYFIDQARFWMLCGFRPGAGYENESAAQEVAECQAQFTLAALRRLRPASQRLSPWVASHVKTFSVNDTGKLTFNRAQPEACMAHTDPNDQALFALPVGTVLVDQSDGGHLRHRDGKNGNLIRLSDLGGRLWQMPEGSFGLWPSSQYHFIPGVERTQQRYRQFVYP